jgi:hypothetical protein
VKKPFISRAILGFSQRIVALKRRGAGGRVSSNGRREERERDSFLFVVVDAAAREAAQPTSLSLI